MARELLCNPDADETRGQGVHNEMDDMKTSEREEAFWCRIVLLQHRLSKLEQENKNLLELVELQREKLGMRPLTNQAVPKDVTPVEEKKEKKPRKKRVRGKNGSRNTHKMITGLKIPLDADRWNKGICQFPSCNEKVHYSGSKYCTRKCAMTHRWVHFQEIQNANNTKPTDRPHSPIPVPEGSNGEHRI